MPRSSAAVAAEVRLSTPSLLENIVHVMFDGFFCHSQMIRNFLIAFAFCYRRLPEKNETAGGLNRTQTTRVSFLSAVQYPV